MTRKTPTITPTLIQKFIIHLQEQERSAATIQKYTHDLNVLCAILYRYAKYKGYDVSASADISTYGDGSDTSDWAEEALSWSVAAQLVNGIGGNQLAPAATPSGPRWP